MKTKITLWNKGKKKTFIHGATGKQLLKYGPDVDVNTKTK